MKTRGSHSKQAVSTHLPSSGACCRTSWLWHCREAAATMGAGPGIQPCIQQENVTRYEPSSTASTSFRAAGEKGLKRKPLPLSRSAIPAFLTSARKSAVTSNPSRSNPSAPPEPIKISSPESTAIRVSPSPATHAAVTSSNTLQWVIGRVLISQLLYLSKVWEL